MAIFKEISGFSSGPPVSQPGQCESMLPGHGVPPQTTSIPYSLTAKTTAKFCYVPGQTVTSKFSFLCTQSDDYK